MSYSRESSTDLRSKILHRDKGICKDCGVDCIALEHHRKHNKAIWLALIKYYEIPEYLHKEGTLWHADHEKPVHRNGAGLGLDNIATRCWKCHAGKTKLEARGRKLTGTNKMDKILRKGKLESRPRSRREKSTD